MTQGSLALCWHVVSLAPLLITVSPYHISVEDAKKSKPRFSCTWMMSVAQFSQEMFILVIVAFIQRSARNISMGLAEILVSVERKTCLIKIAFCVNRDLAVCDLQMESHQKGCCKWRPFFRACILCSMFWCVTLPADICEVSLYMCFGDGLILRPVTIRNYPWFQAELKGTFGIHALSYLTAWVCIADQW